VSILRPWLGVSAGGGLRKQQTRIDGHLAPGEIWPGMHWAVVARLE
jgi:hypothetical protein